MQCEKKSGVDTVDCCFLCEFTRGERSSTLSLPFFAPPFPPLSLPFLPRPSLPPPPPPPPPPSPSQLDPPPPRLQNLLHA